jgi:hypothetical protein
MFLGVKGTKDYENDILVRVKGLISLQPENPAEDHEYKRRAEV